MRLPTEPWMPAEHPPRHDGLANLGALALWGFVFVYILTLVLTSILNYLIATTVPDGPGVHTRVPPFARNANVTD